MCGWATFRQGGQVIKVTRPADSDFDEFSTLTNMTFCLAWQLLSNSVGSLSIELVPHPCVSTQVQVRSRLSRLLPLEGHDLSLCGDIEFLPFASLTVHCEVTFQIGQGESI